MKLNFNFIFEVAHILFFRLSYRQRDQILQYLIDHQHAHVTADQIATRLRGRQFSIGEATIYRYLDKLVTQGRVRKFCLGKAPAHAISISMNPAAVRAFPSKMRGLRRFDSPSLRYPLPNHDHIRHEHGFIVDPSRTVFYGQCAACREKQGGQYHG